MRPQPVLTLVHANDSSPLTYEQHLANVRGMVWNSARDIGLSWKDLAVATGLSYTTVSKFADGTTKWPRHSTVFALQQAVDIDVRFVPKGSRIQPDEILTPPPQSNLELRRQLRRARFRRR